MVRRETVGEESWSGGSGPVERAWALRWMSPLRRAGLRLRRRGRVRLPAAGGERVG